MLLQRFWLTQLMPIALYCIWLTYFTSTAHTSNMEEQPFGLNQAAKLMETKKLQQTSGIHALSRLEPQRGFFHLFHVPYIVCFFAAKGKWPFIPPFMQLRVDNTAKTFFHQNDSAIKQFCQKYIAIKECFRPIFNPTLSPNDGGAEVLEKQRKCKCETEPVVYFDKNYIGNVSSETIYNTIEFLESFLPPPTKKPKRKNNVRGRLDEMEIEVRK